MIHLNNELAKIAKEHSISDEEITATYGDFVSKEKERGLKDKDAKARALRRTQLFYKKTSVGGPTESIELLILGSKEPMDSSAKVREKAMDVWKENPKKAIAEGYCNNDGVPLDRMAEFPGGGKNSNYGKPLKVRFMRVVTGLSEAEKRLVTFIMNGKQATDMEIPLFCKTVLNGKRKENDSFGSTKSTRVLCEDTTYIENLEDILTKVMKKEISAVEAIDEWVLDHGNKDILITVADVLTIDMEPNSTGSRTVILDNGTDFGQRVFVPEHVPIYFGEQSRIILIGGAKPGKEDYGPSVTAMGMYAIPQFMYEPEGNGEYADEAINHGTEDDASEQEVLAAAGQPEDDDQPESDPEDKSLLEVTPTLMLNVIKSQDGGEGVLVSEIVAQARAQGYNPDAVPIVLANLMRDGEIYEPKIGLVTITKTKTEKPAGW